MTGAFLLSAHTHSIVLTAIFVASTSKFAAGAFHSLDNLPYDDNGRLSKHLLVVPEKCSTEVFELYDNDFKPHGRDFIAVKGEASNAFFPDWSPLTLDDETASKPFGCPLACVERGVERAVVSSPLPSYRLEAKAEGRSIQEFKDWLFEKCQKVEIGFVNYLGSPLDFYWVSFNGERRKQGTLDQGEKNTQFITSFLGHKFEFDNPDTGETVFSHVVEYTGIIPLGKPDSPTKDELNPNYETEIKRTLNFEWGRHKRVRRSFSPLGFHIGRLPDDLWSSIQAYYYNNRNDRVLEEWEKMGKGFFVNWWEIDPLFVQIPWELRRVWQSRLRELVEGWAGVELENTDIYGMRQYESGARLLSHVDREQTHAASLIINVAQGNLTSPWTIEVHDHADRLHEVVMKPGDIVYYESAKCLHGRNTPLQGGFYTNLFAHYRPVGDSEWYLRDNPPGTPEPLIDVGECRLVGEIDQYSQGAVQCDDDGIGLHLSPSMFTATSGDDLFDWWKRVADGPPTSSKEHEEL
uniref:Fe2OG dioxygenase domain-containing protein n=1 Tax=Helicotheca tamesis TaxID=374047 RepID=A0A7S2HI77_9STRA|eukprot:CAMPEP_0185727262 /NCGR_PEP_ID=MMETSP1171-20130828/2994_1 /TAXON_ID=374046 /ORGANISM="Helicotheca tamensis, Strain CCMP826" /LENGTH=519 /DNA_ID=CAMNT_0028395789 /DNA_START=23 /DNA_END=1582 /DNA_ORIENTATION=-